MLFRQMHGYKVCWPLGETLKQCVIIEKDGRVGQGISSDGDVGKGLCEQVVCKATSEVRVDISHKKCAGTRSQGRG